MDKNELQLLKKQMVRSNEQGEMMLEIVNHVEDIRNDMSGMYKEIKNEFQEFRDTVPLTDTEADRLQSIVYKKATEFTKEFFGKFVSNELFSKKWGHIISGIYRLLKNKYNVRKFTVIKHVDAETAYVYVSRLNITDLPLNYLRLTDKQIETAEKHSDIVYHDYYSRSEFNLKLM